MRETRTSGLMSREGKRSTFNAIPRLFLTLLMHKNPVSLTNTQPADPSAEHVLRFCRTLVPAARPLVVPILPRDGCELLDCFNNARRQVARDGGRIQLGWAIWEWAHVYVEAEHHAVYDPGNGQPWVDLTPSVDGETVRLFLADIGRPTISKMKEFVAIISAKPSTATPTSASFSRFRSD